MFYVRKQKKFQRSFILIFSLALIIGIIFYKSNSISVVKAQSTNSIDLGIKAPELGIYGAAGLQGENGGTGNAVSIGDLNGDGINDLVVATPRANGPSSDPFVRPGAGVVRIFFGPFTLNDQIDLQQRQASVTIYGPRTGDNLGANLLITDINADGKKDLIMQAPGADLSKDIQNVGKLYVVFGPLLPQTRDLATTAGAEDLQISGAANEDRVGNSMAAGDFDNDGKVDLAIGSPLSTVDGKAQAGAVYIIFGRPNLGGFINLQNLSQSNDKIFSLAVPNAQFGYAVAFGDIDGDQKADLICTAPRLGGTNGAKPNSGAVFVLFNNKLENEFTAFGIDSNDLFGSSLAVADVNGDRIADIIAGAPGGFGPNNSRSGSGEVYILIGGTFSPGQTRDLAKEGQGAEITFFGGSAGDRLGFPYGITAGDTNNDGIADIALVANGGDGPNNSRIDAGNIYLVLGKPSLLGIHDFVTPGVSDNVIFGARSLDQIGSCTETGSPLLRTGSTLSIGDINGDRKGDLAVGAPLADGPTTTPRTDAGAVYVLTELGTPPPPNLPPVITPILNQIVPEGRSVSIEVKAIDPNGDNIELTLNSPPAFVSIADNKNGVGQITIFPPINTPKQVYPIVVTATDSKKLSTSISFNVTVTPPGATINSVKFISKVLTIEGTKLSPNPLLAINGAILPVNVITKAKETLIKASGTRKKLKLQSGKNTIVVIVNGIESDAYLLQLK